MGARRLISVAAGVTPELASDPAGFVSAAAAAGWPATGIWHDAKTWTDQTTRDVGSLLGDTGLVPIDMEVVRIGSESDLGEEIIDIAAELRVRNVLAISQFDDPSQTADRLVSLCQRGAPAGIRVCIEFMRFTTVKTLADAIAVLALADQPNAGILVDLLHVWRSGTTYAEVKRADPALFPYAQWCDGPAEPDGNDNRDLLVEALDGRAIPGEGALDAVGFESLFAEDVPFSAEVRSRALRESFADPVERARHLYERTLRVLDSST